MKHLSTYKLFESTNIREDIEDCCLELSDLLFWLVLGLVVKKNMNL
jgi:hypothetical protein